MINQFILDYSHIELHGIFFLIIANFLREKTREAILRPQLHQLQQSYGHNYINYNNLMATTQAIMVMKKLMAVFPLDVVVGSVAGLVVIGFLVVADVVGFVVGEVVVGAVVFAAVVVDGVVFVAGAVVTLVVFLVGFSEVLGAAVVEVDGVGEEEGGFDWVGWS